MSRHYSVARHNTPAMAAATAAAVCCVPPGSLGTQLAWPTTWPLTPTSVSAKYRRAQGCAVSCRNVQRHCVGMSQGCSAERTGLHPMLVLWLPQRALLTHTHASFCCFYTHTHTHTHTRA